MIIRFICMLLYVSTVLVMGGCQKGGDLCCEAEGFAGERFSEAFVTLDSLSEPYNPFPELAIQQDAIAQHLTYVTRKVFNKWLAETSYSLAQNGVPRIIITEIQNNTDHSLTDAQLREWFTDIAATDGRFTIVLACTKNEATKTYLQSYLLNDPYYSNSSVMVDSSKALQCFASVQLSAVGTPTKSPNDKLLIDLTLYDIENDQIAISDWDVLDANKEAFGPR